MQSVHRPSHFERTHQISFSSLENYNSKSESRNQSPSIAVESILELNQQNEESIASLHANHKKYLFRKEQATQGRDGLKIKYTDRSVKQNKALNHVFRNESQTKQEKISSYFKKMCDNKEQKTSLRNQALKQININNESNYFSNMSPVKNEQIDSLSINRQNNHISSLKWTNQNQNQYVQLSPTSYSMLTQRYLCSTNKSNPSHICHQQIENEISKLQRQIQRLQKLKRETKDTGQASEQFKLSSIVEQFWTKNSIFNKDPIHVNTETPKQMNFESIQWSKTSQESVISSQIIKVKLQTNEEDVKRPKLLNKTSKKSKNNDSQTTSNVEPSLQSHRAAQSSRKLPSASPTLPTKTKITDYSQKKQLQQLLHSLQNQIKLDEILRKSKKWLQKWHCEGKWEDLNALLKKKNIYLTQPTIKKVFNVSSQEQNPFYTPKDTDFTLNQLSQNYSSAQNHWTSKIAGQFSLQMLKRCSFIEENIDISRRGEISIQDLVRYINFQLDSFYRNRDIFLIFKRFKKEEKLQFTDILRCLSNQSF